NVHATIAAADEKTFRKWSWAILEALASLNVIQWRNRFHQAPAGVRLFVSLDGTDFAIQEPKPFDKKWWSHKLNRAALRYEVGICIRTGCIVWVHGGKPAGEWPDLKLAQDAYVLAVQKDEMALADKGYMNRRYFVNPKYYPSSAAAQKKIMARHETANARFKQFGVLKNIFRHKVEDHMTCFLSVANLVQIAIECESPFSQHVFQAQVDIPYDLDNVVDPVRVHVVDRLSAHDFYTKTVTAIDPEIVQRVSPFMTYKRRVSEDASGESWAVNVLYREFHDPDRVTFVGQTVEDDKFEKFAYSKRESITWVVVTRVAPSTTRVTFMSLSSLEYTEQGFLSLENQARNYGLQLDGNDPSIAEIYASRLKVVGDPGVATYTAYLNDVVEATKERANVQDHEDLLNLFLQ
ncbi:hypothetical protein AeRB84_009541, partial [Aphanomyces euteiches]